MMPKIITRVRGEVEGVQIEVMDCCLHLKAQLLRRLGCGSRLYFSGTPNLISAIGLIAPSSLSCCSVFGRIDSPPYFKCFLSFNTLNDVKQVMSSCVPFFLRLRSAASQALATTARRTHLRTYASTPSGKTTQPHRPGGQGDRLRIFPLIFIFCAATGTYVLMVRQRAKQAEEEAQAYRFKSSAAASRRQ